MTGDWRHVRHYFTVLHSLCRRAILKGDVGVIYRVGDGDAALVGGDSFRLLNERISPRRRPAKTALKYLPGYMIRACFYPAPVYARWDRKCCLRLRARQPGCPFSQVTCRAGNFGMHHVLGAFGRDAMTAAAARTFALPMLCLRCIKGSRRVSCLVSSPGRWRALLIGTRSCGRQASVAAGEAFVALRSLPDDMNFAFFRPLWLNHAGAKSTGTTRRRRRVRFRAPVRRRGLVRAFEQLSATRFDEAHRAGFPG